MVIVRVQHAEPNFCCVNSQKQHLAGRHVNLLRHITPSEPVVSLSPRILHAWQRSCDYKFLRVWSHLARIKPTTFHTGGKHATLRPLRRSSALIRIPVIKKILILCSLYQQLLLMLEVHFQFNNWNYFLFNKEKAPDWRRVKEKIQGETEFTVERPVDVPSVR